MYIKPRMRYKGNLTRGRHKWNKNCKDMDFNEKLQKLLEQAQGVEPFNYDNVFKEKNEFHILLQVKLKALSMEEKDIDLCWDVVQDIAQKDIGKVYKRYERLYMHRISQMEKVIPSFQYQPLVLSP